MTCTFKVKGARLLVRHGVQRVEDIRMKTKNKDFVSKLLADLQSNIENDFCFVAGVQRPPSWDWWTAVSVLGFGR